MTWEKVEPYTGTVAQGCLNCLPVEKVAPMEMLIAVGFGSACVTCDDEIVYGEMEFEREGKELWTTQDAENEALKNPEHDWRIEKFGPLHGEVYQRHEPGKWVLIDSNIGFI